MPELCMDSHWIMYRDLSEPPSLGCDNVVALTDHMFAFSDNVVLWILHVKYPACTCVQFCVQALWLLTSVPLLLCIAPALPI